MASLILRIKTIINIQRAIGQIFECLATQFIGFILQYFLVFEKLYTLWCLQIHWLGRLLVLALCAAFIFRVFFVYVFFLYFLFLRSHFFHWRLYFAFWEDGTPRKVLKVLFGTPRTRGPWSTGTWSTCFFSHPSFYFSGLEKDLFQEVQNRRSGILNKHWACGETQPWGVRSSSAPRIPVFHRTDTHI